MWILLTGAGLLLVSGLGSALARKSNTRATRLGGFGAVAGCGLAMIPTLRVLFTGNSERLHLPWEVPWGSFHVEIDPLSAWFLIPILAISALAALYGGEYLKSYGSGRAGASWLPYNCLIAGMVMAVIARNGILFLMAWEIMSLASFFLVTLEHEKEETQKAGWTYLIATHLGTLFLLVMFILLGSASESLDFDRFAPQASSNVLFLLALIGFGTKAGFMPLHVWLPEAHPAAPSHVSAVMSGVMIKTGIYGLVRMLMVLGPPPIWWAWLLIGIGLTSGILGVLFALAQHDLKRLLAYHSVENIGIIALGLGVGVLGICVESPVLAVAGFAGGLLHVLNHAIFKSLLFLAAGAVAHGTGTRTIDRLGGLLKRMPLTGTAFLFGAAAISGLPPFNGFISEFLIYFGAFSGGITLPPRMLVGALAVIPGLALIGGLAAACFTKAFGMVFLGEPRTPEAQKAHEPGRLMQIPMMPLAACCLLMGLAAPLVVPWMAPILPSVTHLPIETVLPALNLAIRPLTVIAVASAGLLLLIGILASLRRHLLKGRAVEETVTWDCGYAKPAPRMQYTASSFAQPITNLFDALLLTRKHVEPPEGYFPRQASLETHTPDIGEERIYRPAFTGLAWAASKLRWLQSGGLHLYVLYIALTLILLLVWKLGAS